MQDDTTGRQEAGNDNATDDLLNAVDELRLAVDLFQDAEEGLAEKQQELLDNRREVNDKFTAVLVAAARAGAARIDVRSALRDAGLDV